MILNYLIVSLILLNHWNVAQIPPLAVSVPEASSTTKPNSNEPPIVGDSAKIADLRAELEANEMVSQIHASLQMLTETSHIHQQVQDAIRDQTYARPGFVNGDGEAAAAPPSSKETSSFAFPKFDLIKFLVGHAEKTDQVGAVLKPDDVGASSAETSGASDDRIRDFLRSSLEEVTIEGLNTNVIDSEYVNHLMGKSENAVAISKHQNRENLHLVSVHEDATFTLGHNVSMWHTQIGTSDKNHALLGVTDRSLLLLLENNGTYRRQQEILVNTSIFASTTFMKWNGKEMDEFAVLAVENEIQFVQIWTESGRMEVVWKWNVLRAVKVILYFQIEGQDTLLLINSIPSKNTNNQTHYSADIYSFELGARQMWLLQKIPLDHAAENAHFMEMGREYVLVFPQQNSVELFRYSRSVDINHKFVHLKSIESPKVRAVACFQIGGLSYIAIGGQKPQILRYHRQQFYSQTILSTSWGIVEHILPIAARTYRDDLILLVQHRVWFDGGHSVPALEALIWNGDAFVTAALSVPCYFNGVLFESGITCVLDAERDVGIEGASVIQRGTNISLLVPRFEAPSGLFFLSFRLDPVDNPVVSQEQHTSFELLQKFNAQTDVISAAETVLLNSVDSPTKFTVDWTVEDLETGVVQVDDLSQLKYAEFWLGDTRMTAVDLEADLPAMLGLLEQYTKEVDELEREALDSPSVSLHSAGNGQFKMDGYRLLREKRNDKARMPTLNVKNLQVEYINDIPVKDFVFADANGDIDLSGSDVILDNEIAVDGDIKLANQTNAQLGEALDSSNLTVHVTGNVTVDSINGMDFNEFLSNLVMVNLPNTLENLVVEGPVRFKDLYIGDLNNISFITGYVWNHQFGAATKITGKKTFTGQLHAREIRVAGLLDGINTRNVVLLHDTQTITGHTTFEHLEISDHLEVTGNISGRHVNDFLANPSLLHAKLIPTNCTFNTLIVEGPIVVGNTMQGVNLDAVLSDVVYSNESLAKINAIKTFDTLEVDQLSAGMINGVAVDEFMTVNTEQEVELNRLAGNVVFKELQIDGLFDFINITELEKNAIRLEGDQFTESELVFENPEGFGVDLVANNVNVMFELNGTPLDQLVSLSDPLDVVANVELEGAIVVNLVHEEGDVVGKGVLSGTVLGDLNRTRVSLSDAQEITAPYFIRKATIVGDINAMQVNGVPVVGIQQHVQSVQKLTQDLSSGHMVVQKLIVDGSVTLSEINGHDFESIKSNAIWLDMPNTIGGSLVFEQSVELAAQFQVDSVKDVQFNEFVAGVVRRGDLAHTEFAQPMTFERGIQVMQSLQAARIGEVDGARIFNRNSNTLNGLKVKGNVSVDTLSVSGTLNGVTLQDFSNHYLFDELRQRHIVRTPKLRFLEQVIADEIWLHQESPNISAFLASVVRKNKPTIITGAKEFQGRVQFQRELQVDLLNGIDLNRFLDTVVVNELGVAATISGDVAFENRVRGWSIDVHGDVIADQLIGERWPNWLRDGIRIDQPTSIESTIHFGPGALRADNIRAVHVNGIAVDEMITTNTEQIFNVSPNFSNIEAAGNVYVGGLVNGVFLPLERENTVMTLGNFHITAVTRIQSARVMRTLQTKGPISGRNLTLLAPLNADLTLVGAFSFEQLVADELRTNEPISGIEFTHWAANSLLQHADHHIVEGHWAIQHLEAQSVAGSSTINGMKVSHLSERMLNLTQTADTDKLAAKQEHQALCKSLHGVLKKSQNFKYSLDHFEVAFKVGAEFGQINSFQAMQWEQDKYLVVNSGCTSQLYIWDSVSGGFVLRQHVETGVVDEWLSTKDGDVRSVVSNSAMLQMNCTRSGIIIWTMTNHTLEFVHQIGDPLVQYQLNLNQQPFRDVFYALNPKARTVTEFYVFGTPMDAWQLPAPQEDCEDIGFMFLPDGITTELALSDGVHLSRLSANRNTSSTRQKRFFERQIKEGIEKLGQTIRESHENNPLFINAQPNAKGPLTGLFSPTTSDKLATNLPNRSDIKLKLFPASEQPITWVGNPATWPKLETSSPLIGPIRTKNFQTNPLADDQERSSLYLQATINKNEGVDNPEKVIMAPPPAIYSEDETLSQPKINASTTRNESAGTIDEDQRPLNGSQPRMDLFGSIEKEAKKLSDRIFDNTFGKPVDAIEDNNDDDDIETQAVDSTGNDVHIAAISATEPAESTTIKLGFDLARFESTTSGPIGVATEIPARSDIYSTNGPEVDVKDTIVSTEAPKLDINQEPNVPSSQNSLDTSTVLSNSTNIHTNAPTEQPEVGGIMDAVRGVVSVVKDGNKTKTNDVKSPANGEPTEPTVGGIIDIVRNVVTAVKEGGEIIHEIREEIKERHQLEQIAAREQDPFGAPLFRNAFLGSSAASTEAPSSEANIGVAVLTEGGVSTTENRILPGQIDGAEIITLEVGSDHRRTLVAISHWQPDTVKGHQDNIKIYEDVIEGRIFHTIACHRPRSLAALRLRTETLLAFVERDAEMRVFVYRGIEGFVAFTQFTVEEPVIRFRTMALPAVAAHTCPRHFLVVQMAHELRFVEAIMSGYCGLEVALNCEG